MLQFVERRVNVPEQEKEEVALSLKLVMLSLKLITLLLSTVMVIHTVVLFEEVIVASYVHHLVATIVANSAKHFGPHFGLWPCVTLKRAIAAPQPPAIPDTAISLLWKKMTE